MHRARVQQCRCGRGGAPARRKPVAARAGAKDVGALLRDAVRDAPGQGQSPLTLQAAGRFLAELGVAPAQVSRVLDVATNKNSVYGTQLGNGRTVANPWARPLDEADCRAAVERLEGWGFERAQVAAVVAEQPAVLSYPEGRVLGLLRCLEEVGLERAEVVAAVAARPSILGLDEDAVRRMVGFLGAAGTERGELLRLLQTTL